MPAHTISNRKKTIMGSRRIHRVYRKVMNNKAMTVVLMAIVAPLVGLLMTSKGMPTPHYKVLRKMLMKLPFGNFLGKLLQQLVDVARRLLGIGIREGDVVQLLDKNDIGNKIAVRKLTFENGLPEEDTTYTEFNEEVKAEHGFDIFSNKYVVYRIRNRKLQLVPCHDAIKKYSGEEVTKLTLTELDKITKSNGAEVTVFTNPDGKPFAFPQEHFKKADFQLDLTP